MQRAIPILAISMLAPNTANGQGIVHRPPMRTGTFEEATRRGPVPSTVFLNPSRAHGGLGSLYVVRLDNSNVKDTLPLPIDRGGGMVHLSEGRFLVSGFTPPSSGALLELSIRTIPTIDLQILQRTDWPSVDPTDITYHRSEQMLYILDALGRRVLSCPWPGMGPVDTSLAQVCFGAELCRLLDNPRAVAHLAVTETGSMYLYSHSRAFAHFERGPNGWQEVPLQTTPDWQIRNQRLEATQEGFYLKGRTGAYEVVEVESGRTVATGAHEDPQTWEYVTPRNPLIPGMVHEVRTPAAGRGTRFVPTLRYGRPATGTSLQLARGSAVCMSFPTPGVTVGITVPYAVPAELPVPDEIEVVIAMGFRDSQGNDPVETSGHDAQLVPSRSISVTLPTGGHRHGHLTHMLELPASPAVHGRVILFQVAQPTSAAQSDVFGTLVHRPGR